jgi:hypothetical protein
MFIIVIIITCMYEYCPLSPHNSIIIIIIIIIIILSRNSVVGIATSYGLDDGGVGVRVPLGSKKFYSPCRPDRLWAHPASYPTVTGVSFSEGKEAGV